MKTLKFHTGRGGRFYNSGHVTFEGIEDMDLNSCEFEGMFPLYEEDVLDENYRVIEVGKPILDKYGNQVINHPSGDELDYEYNSETGTGYINIDHDYNTTRWVKEYELNNKQVYALQRAVKYESYYDLYEIKRILNEYYSEYY